MGCGLAVGAILSDCRVGGAEEVVELSVAGGVAEVLVLVEWGVGEGVWMGHG